MDELQISGKRFISSRRIARENGYTSDYIGQLIRGGKVVGQKVGRAWYVDAASFNTYLGSEGVTPLPAPVEEPEPVATAAPVAVEVQEEKEIVPEPVAAPAPEAAKTIEEPKAMPVVVEAEVVEEEVQHVPLRVIKAASPGGLRYYADDTPSLPEIRTEKKESRIVEAVEEDGEVDSVAVPPARQTGHRYVAGLAVLGFFIFIFSAVLSSAVSLDLSIEAGNAAATSYSLAW